AASPAAHSTRTMRQPNWSRPAVRRWHKLQTKGPNVSVQRLRVYFRKGERVRYISHLDVMRFWERAIRRAGLPLTYSKGFNPHPKLQFAGPLPLGFTGQREIIDVFLDDRISEEQFRSAVDAQSTEDLEIV